MLEKINEDAKRRMKKSVEAVVTELAGVRTGKATTALLDNLKVEAYGQKTPLNQLASISVPDPKSLVIQPWDKSITGDVVKAIQTSELGFNPQVDGNIIRVPVPPLSEERRTELVKFCKKIAEEGKVAIRNIRRDANEALKTAEKEKQLSRDDQRKGSDLIQKLTDEYADKIDELVVAKEKEVMSV